MPLSEQTDDELISATLAGESASFAVLVERYISAIYKFSYRYVRNGLMPRISPRRPFFVFGKI